MPDDTNPADANPGDTKPDSTAERDRKVYADVAARYYGDPAFRAEVDANPDEALRAAGIWAPEGKKIKLLLDTKKRTHVVIPLPRDRAGGAG